MDNFVVRASHDTPEHWKEYLDYLDDRYKTMSEAWKLTCKDREAEIAALPWWKKIFVDELAFSAELQWLKPQKEKPSIVGYYNWDVNIKAYDHE
jgi:hypothetical protein